MSSTFLRIIPTSPSFVPNTILQKTAKMFLGKFYGNEQIQFLTTDMVEFIDQGENFETVSCNVCGHIIEVDDWQRAMDKAFERQFSDLSIYAPCCGKETSLNDLTYQWPAGFAKFHISISEAQDELAKTDLMELQKIFGTTLRIIWAHY